MNKTLKISESLTLPLEAVTQTFAIVARKRVGKTYTASVLAEEMIEAEIPIVVLDPTGAWWGLRSMANGKAEGYPVVIIGGEHGDVPLDEHGGKVIADLVVDHPGYYIIDFSGMENNAAQDRFATDFGLHFYRRKQGKRFPIHLFIDEADCFMPQQPFDNQKRMLGAFDTIIRRGGISGIGVTMITQRPAVLNKNALTQAETLIALQMSGSQDIDAIEHWTRIHGSKAQRDEMIGSLASLQRGNCWFWSPSWLQKFERVRIRERRTYNSSATPEMGTKVIIQPKLAAVDLKKLGESIQTAVETVKANDPAALKARIKELEKKIAQLTRDGAQSNASAKTEVKEVPVFSEEERKLITGADKSCVALQQDVAEIIGNLKGIQAELAGLNALAHKKISAVSASPVENQKRSYTAGLVISRTVTYNSKSNSPAAVYTGDQVDEFLPEGEAKLLTALIQYPDGLARSQLTVLTGYKRSSRDAYIHRLRTKGLAETAGDNVMATQAGIDRLPEAEPLPQGAALQDFWRNKLPSGEWKILEQLIAVFPEASSRDSLTELTGFMRSSRDAYLHRLRSKQLITEPGRGDVRASETLFDVR